jgi:hypothetical protein
MYMLRVAFAERDFAIVEEARSPICQAHEHESATADVAGGRFDDGECERHGNGRIHGVAATLEDFDSGLGTKLLIGRDHSMRRAHGLLGPIFRIDRMRAKLGRCLRAGNAATDEREREHKGEMLRANAQGARNFHETANSKGFTQRGQEAARTT